MRTAGTRIRVGAWATSSLTPLQRASRLCSAILNGSQCCTATRVVPSCDAFRMGFSIASMETPSLLWRAST